MNNACDSSTASVLAGNLPNPTPVIRADSPDACSHTYSGRWHEFEFWRHAQHLSVAAVQMGSPGLWKTVLRDSGLRCVFEFPDWTLSGPEEDEWNEPEGVATLDLVFAWAKEVVHGRVPPGWHPPVAAVAQSWLRDGALTVLSRGLLRQGQMILSADRWALRMPLVEQVPGDLPPERRIALEDLLLEAQSRWAMARVGFHPQAGGTGIIAEVDLTGAPHREPLLLAALEALRSVTAWVVEPAELLADVRVEISALALRFNNKQQGKPNEATE